MGPLTERALAALRRARDRRQKKQVLACFSDQDLSQIAKEMHDYMRRTQSDVSWVLRENRRRKRRKAHAK